MNRKILFVLLSLTVVITLISLSSATPLYFFKLNNTINTGTCTSPACSGNDNQPQFSTFQLGTGLHLIRGSALNGYYGYTWNSTAWVSNSTVVSGITNTGSRTVSATFNYNGRNYLLTGFQQVTNMTGYTQNASGGWTINNTVISGLGVYDTPAPTPVLLGNSINLLVLNSSGDFYGFTWNGTGWISNTTIKNGLAFGSNSGAVLGFGIISGQANLFNERQGWYWNGSYWIENSQYSAPLSCSGSTSCTTSSVFNISTEQYILTGYYRPLFAAPEVLGAWGYHLEKHFTENGQIFTNNTFSLSTESFYFNITYDPSYYSSAIAYLFYNNTQYTSTSASQGTNTTIFNASVTIPLISNQINKTFYWTLLLSNSTGTDYFNSTFNNQTISNISLDNCASNTVLLLNYTLRDEDSQAIIANTSSLNMSQQVYVLLYASSNPSFNLTTSFTRTNTNPVQVCSSVNLTNFQLDAVNQYSATGYVTEYHNIQNYTLANTLTPRNINLYDLLTTRSQEFLITFKDENFLPVEGALIDITRFYISEGVFKSVEIVKTDADGQALGHFVLSSEIYTLVVSKNGRVLGTFPNVVTFCNDISTGDCKINLNSFSSGPQIYNFRQANDLYYSLTFNQSSLTVSSDFVIPSGFPSTISLNVSRFDNYGNYSLCTSTLVTSSGTVSCTLPAGLGNVSIIASLYKDGVFITQGLFTIKPSAASVFGGTRIIMIVLLFMTIPLIGLSSGAATVILSMVSMIIAGILNLYENGSYVGVGATILWFMIAGGVLLWKISRR